VQYAIHVMGGTDREDRNSMTANVKRTPSEEEWLAVTAFLNRNRYRLGVRAADGYPAGLRVAGTPLLAPPAWRLAAPVPLDAVRLEFQPDTPPPDVPDLAAMAPYLLPERTDGSRYGRYTDVVAALIPPTVFENRPVYRLTQADLAGKSGPLLAFGRGRFFDGADANGAAGHEYAAAQLGEAGAGCPCRAALGGPAGLSRRCAQVAASALTLRYDKRTGTATFPLHYRAPGKVSHAGGLYQVIPVGVFQPSGEAPWNEANDFSLWRGLLREYAEELLGADEDHGSEQAPIDYRNWPLAKSMTDGVADGTVRAWCLGLGADPLTFALDLLVVVVIDAPLYDGLFGDMVDGNAEGRIIEPRPFDVPSLTELLAGTPLQAAAAGLLSLALTHRGTLLGARLPAALAPLFQVRPLGTRPAESLRRSYLEGCSGSVFRSVRASAMAGCCGASGTSPIPTRSCLLYQVSHSAGCALITASAAAAQRSNATVVSPSIGTGGEISTTWWR
jgi:hypothetical protein